MRKAVWICSRYCLFLPGSPRAQIPTSGNVFFGYSY